MIPPFYPISDEEYSRLHEKPIAFNSIPVGNKILSGEGLLRIQRDAREGIHHEGLADISVERWYGDQNVSQKLYLPERLFRSIEQRSDGAIRNRKGCLILDFFAGLLQQRFRQDESLALWNRFGHQSGMEMVFRLRR